MLHLALMTLTLTPEGDVRLTLSEMENQAACQESLEQIVDIMANSDVEMVGAMCGKTKLLLTPFEHGEEEPFFYMVETDHKTMFTISPLPEGTTCDATNIPGATTFCARSSQDVLVKGNTPETN